MSETECKEADASTELMECPTHVIQSKETTQEEQALGFFTCKKLKTLSTLEMWHQGEIEQLDQFEDLQMFGKPSPVNKQVNPIAL